MWWCFGGKWWYFRVEVDMMRKDLTSLTSHLGWIRSSHMNVNTCECVYIYMCVCVCWGQGGQLALSLCESGRHAHTGQSGGCPWWQGWREDAETNTHIHTHNIRENTDLRWDTGSESQCWAMLSASLGGETKHKSTEEPQHVLSQELQNQPRNHKVLVFCFSFISCQISAVPVVNVHIKHDQSFWYWAQCTAISASPELSHIYILRLSQLFLL